MVETLTLAEVAKILKIDPNTLRLMALNGEIDAFKLSSGKNSEYRFTVDDLHEFIRRNRVVKREEVKA